MKGACRGRIVGLLVCVGQIVATGVHVNVAHAQIATIIYLPGWNMVGGPIHKTLSLARGVFAYTPEGYVAAPPVTPQGCDGYWAYFAETEQPDIAYPGPTAPPPHESARTCPLHTGWNLVGDPFESTALLPATTIAYSWRPSYQDYETLPYVSAARAVWIYADTPGSVTLTPTQ